MKEFYFKSNGKYDVVVRNGYVKWTRRGIKNRLSHGSKGEVSIPIESISTVQLKAPKLTTGYIRFVQHGSSTATERTIDAIQDEKAILFTKREIKQAEELKQLVESLLHDKDPGTTAEEQND